MGVDIIKLSLYISTYEDMSMGLKNNDDKLAANLMEHVIVYSSNRDIMNKEISVQS